jgi:hypothetical protein
MDMSPTAKESTTKEKSPFAPGVEIFIPSILQPTHAPVAAKPVSIAASAS